MKLARRVAYTYGRKRVHDILRLFNSNIGLLHRAVCSPGGLFGAVEINAARFSTTRYMRAAITREIRLIKTRPGSPPPSPPGSITAFETSEWLKSDRALCAPNATAETQKKGTVEIRRFDACRSCTTVFRSMNSPI